MSKIHVVETGSFGNVPADGSAAEYITLQARKGQPLTFTASCTTESHGDYEYTYHFTQGVDVDTVVISNVPCVLYHGSGEEEDVFTVMNLFDYDLLNVTYTLDYYYRDVDLANNYVIQGSTLESLNDAVVSKMVEPTTGNTIAELINTIESFKVPVVDDWEYDMFDLTFHFNIGDQSSDYITSASDTNIYKFKECLDNGYVVQYTVIPYSSDAQVRFSTDRTHSVYYSSTSSYASYLTKVYYDRANGALRFYAARSGGSYWYDSAANLKARIMYRYKKESTEE